MHFSRGPTMYQEPREKVSPREIENVLHAVPGVCEAVVAGVADPIVGEALLVFATSHPGATINERDILTPRLYRPGFSCAAQRRDRRRPSARRLEGSLAPPRHSDSAIK